jgi:hypothetical protein
MRTYSRCGLVLFVTCCFLFSGCVIRHRYELSGAVKNGENEGPLGGVKIMVLDDPDEAIDVSDLVAEAFTGKDGTYSFEQFISLQKFGDDDKATKYLVFFKEGFRKETLKIVFEKSDRNKVAVPVRVPVLRMEREPAKNLK